MFVRSSDVRCGLWSSLLFFVVLRVCVVSCDARNSVSELAAAAAAVEMIGDGDCQHRLSTQTRPGQTRTDRRLFWTSISLPPQIPCCS